MFDLLYPVPTAVLFGSSIDAARYLVTVAGKPVHLTPIEFWILAVLARFRGS